MDDEWCGADNFASREFLDAFHESGMPPKFLDEKKRKVGDKWLAPAEWIEKERKQYYKDNPKSLPRGNLRRRLERVNGK
ncbi:hypothetical protein CPB86DRAFT_780568 [Serendipita vermifera]|nr:hypothetical protein CPB86DRAFT_780568 [Serendipita vermifera]